MPSGLNFIKKIRWKFRFWDSQTYCLKFSVAFYLIFTQSHDNLDFEISSVRKYCWIFSEHQLLIWPFKIAVPWIIAKSLHTNLYTFLNVFAYLHITEIGLSVWWSQCYWDTVRRRALLQVVLYWAACCQLRSAFPSTYARHLLGSPLSGVFLSKDTSWWRVTSTIIS